MFIRRSQATMRSSPFMDIHNYITKDLSNNFSLAYVELHGTHNPTRNLVSDRSYFIVNGSAVVTVEGESAELCPGDAVLIPAGSRHGIEGTAQYIVINSPPFDPANEEAG